MLKNSTSTRVLILFLGLVFVWAVFGFGKWNRNITLGGDAWGYYVYLPALFIHNDISQLQEAIRIREALHPGTTSIDQDGTLRVGEAPAVDSNNVIKYTYGVGLMHLPAFSIAHGISTLSNKHESNGYSAPYLIAIYLSTIAYVLLGLWLIALVLLKRFSLKSVLLVVGLLGLSTNLFYFSTINNGMAHPQLFFLWALLIYLSEKYYRKSSWLTFTVIGAVVGLITVIRPVELICVAIPLFWGLKSKNEFLERVSYFIKKPGHVLGAILGGVLLLAPQIIYWKFTSGKWLYYSYPGESFDFTNPMIWKGLAGFTNGWLIYTPVMILSLIGLIQMIRSKSNNRLLILMLVLIHIYLTYSWWNWYYINGFGSRPMIDIYPVLAIPMAVFLSSIKKRLKWNILGAFLIFFTALNLFQTWQQYKGILWSESANKNYYLQCFGQTSFNSRISVALDSRRFQPLGLTTGERIISDDFEEDSNPNIISGKGIENSKGLEIHTPKTAREPFWIIPYESCNIDESKDNHLFIKSQIFVENLITDFYLADAIIIEYAQGEKRYGARRIRLSNKAGTDDEISIWSGPTGQWHQMSAYLPVDFRFKPGDNIHIFLEHLSPAFKTYIDDFELYLSN